MRTTDQLVNLCVFCLWREKMAKDHTTKVAFRNPGAAWHPLRVMSRTDGTLTTLFHCVMALERVDESGGLQERGTAQVRVVWRAPQQSREYVKDLEENVVYQFLSTVATSTEAEKGALPPRYGVVSYTLFDSKRFEGFYKSNADGSKFIVAISSLPLHSTCRRMFDLIDNDATNLNNLCSIFTTLCEAPVLPACGLVYELRFPCGRGLPLHVSINEQFDDDDVFAVALQVLNPRMLVLVWESLLLERHVLVVSSHPSLLAPCCEFLKRLILPLAFVGSYIPHLPDANLIDAPVPYLHGISAQRLRSSGADLAGVVVLDLDAGQISVPASEMANSQCAPPSLLASLLQELTLKWSAHLAAWAARPDNNTPWAATPATPMAQAERANAVLQVFVRQNLALLSARTCGVFIFTGAFCRWPVKLTGSDVVGDRKVERLSARPSGDLDIIFNVSAGREVVSGALLLLQPKGRRSLQVWVEADSTSLLVYRFEDELPIVSVPVKDLQSVVGIPMEPEGHIFEVVTSQHATHRFQAADPEARLRWITVLDGSISRGAGGTGGAGEDWEAASPPLVGDKRAERDCVQALQTAHHRTSPAAGAGAGRADGDGDGLPSAALGAADHLTALGPGQGQAAYYNSIVHMVSVSTGGPLSRGPALPVDEDERMLTAFRTLCLRTQTVSFLEEKCRLGEGPSYDALLTRMLSPQQVLELAQRSCETAEETDLFSSPDSRISAVVASFVKEPSSSSVEAQQQSPEVSKHRGKDSSPTAASAAVAAAAAAAAAAAVATYGKVDGGGGGEAGPASAFAGADTQTRSPGQCPLCGANLKPKPKSNVFFGLFSSTGAKDKEREKEKEARFEPCSSDACSARAAVQDTLVAHRRQSFLSALQQTSAVLTRVAAAHHASDEELHAALLERRVELLAALLQLHADVKRGAKEAPIVLDLCPPGPAVAVSPDAKAEAWTDVFGALWGAISSGGDSSASVSDLAPACRAHLVSSLLAQQPLGDTPPPSPSLASSSSASNASRDELSEVVHGLLGLLYEAGGQYGQALTHYSRCCLVEQSRVMFCLVHSLAAEPSSFASNAVIKSFLRSAAALSPLVALQAFRLVAQLAHRHSVSRLSEISSGPDDDEETQRELLELQHAPETALGPSLSRRGLAGRMESAGSGSGGGGGGASGGGDQRHQHAYSQRTNSSSPSAAAAGGAGGAGRDKRDPLTLNEAYTCSSAHAAADPCSLSHALACRLNELVLVFCQSPAGARLFERVGHGMLRLALPSSSSSSSSSAAAAGGVEAVKEIRKQSAFREFEIQACELQKADLAKLSTEAERLLFWVNVHNTLCLHAVLLRGTPGTNKFERFAFMKFRYRIGPHLFSLFDIEHGILRACGSRPSTFAFNFLPVFAPLAASDPRRAFALTERCPFVNFVLFNASTFSPPFLCLASPARVKDDLAAWCREYLRMYVRVRRSDSTIFLPCVFWLYWADFASGEKPTVKSDVVRLLLRHAPTSLRDKIEDIIRPQPAASLPAMTTASSRGVPSTPVLGPPTSMTVGVGAALAVLTAEKSRAQSNNYRFVFDALDLSPALLIATR